MQRGLAVLIAIACTGCSFFATSSPKPYPQPPSCSRSKGPPALDAIIAVTAVLAAPAAGIKSKFVETKEQEQAWATTAGLLAVTGITFSVSALVGAFRVKKCDRAHRTWESIQNQQQMYGPYGPPPYGQQPYPQQPYPQQPYPQQPYPYPQQPYPQQQQPQPPQPPPPNPRQP